LSSSHAGCGLRPGVLAFLHQHQAWHREYLIFIFRPCAGMLPAARVHREICVHMRCDSARSCCQTVNFCLSQILCCHRALGHRACMSAPLPSYLPVTCTALTRQQQRTRFCASAFSGRPSVISSGHGTARRECLGSCWAECGRAIGISERSQGGEGSYPACHMRRGGEEPSRWPHLQPSRRLPRRA